MSKFGLYNIVLKDINDGVRIFEYELDDVYFAKIDSPEVQRGKVLAKVTVTKKPTNYDLLFQLEGVILIPCNRCLDDMEQFIKHNETIQVKFGASFSEENEVVIVPELEGSINIAWFLYEFIVLNIPIKHIHAPGECNKNMVDKLKRHITRQKDDTDDNSLFDDDGDDGGDITPDNTQPDPRWENLQNISFDNN